MPRQKQDLRRRLPYLPTVRPRAMREDGFSKLSPGYPDPGDVKTRPFQPADGTTRQTMVTPTANRRIRIIRIWVKTPTAAIADRTVEFYFGTGANITTNPAKAIDRRTMSSSSEATTRTWGRGVGPLGAKDEVLSMRFATISVGATYEAIIEYTEEP